MVSKLKFKFGDNAIWKSEFFGEVKGMVTDYDKKDKSYWFEFDNSYGESEHRWIEEKDLEAIK